MKPKEILFISYYLDPSNLVGAKRMSYWASNIENISNKKYKPTVLTSSLDKKKLKEDFVKRITIFVEYLSYAIKKRNK